MEWPRARLVWDPSQEEKPQGWTRLVCFSDTHGLQDQIKHRPEADVLIHAGDLTNTGELEQVQSLVKWLTEYPAQQKIIITGNHDITFQPEYYEKNWSRFHSKPYDCRQVRELLNTSCFTYLEDEQIDINGYQIYGSPWQPEFCDWAFNLEPGVECKSVWDRIPSSVDILVTHGPPFGMNDTTSQGQQKGCNELLKAIQSRNIPVSIAGHIHSGYGVTGDGVTLFANASTCDHDYKPINSPIVIDLPPAAELRMGARAMADARPTPRAAWDEEDITVSAREELEDLLKKAMIETQGALTIQEITTPIEISGKATAINKAGHQERGKLQQPLICVEFQVAVTWRGEFEGKEVFGRLEVGDLDSIDLDSMEVSAKGTGPSKNMQESEKAAEVLSRDATPLIKQATNEMCRRLSQRCAGLGCFL